MKKFLCDIRQSPYWEKYMHALSWKSARTKNGTLLLFFPLLGVTLAKAQRVNNLTDRDLLEIDTICKKNRCVFIKLEMQPLQDTSLVLKHGYVKTDFFLAPPLTQVINLTKSEKALWEDLSRSGKYGVNRAKREGAVCKFYVNPSDELLEQFHEMEKQTSSKKHFYIQSAKDLFLRRDIFKEKCILEIVYDSNGVACGGKYFICYNNTALFLKGGMSDTSRNSRSGFALMWEAILYFKNAGYEKLDLDGIYDERFKRQTHDWHGFSDFKAKFGGYRVMYPCPYIKYFVPILKFINSIVPISL